MMAVKFYPSTGIIRSWIKGKRRDRAKPCLTRFYRHIYLRHLKQDGFMSCLAMRHQMALKKFFYPEKTPHVMT